MAIDPRIDKSNGSAEEPRFSVSAASIDITPSSAVDMGSGPQARSVLPRPVADEPLEANILYIRDQLCSENGLLLVSLDVLYPGAELREAIDSAARDLPQERILVGASHTHRAPMTCESSPSLGAVDTEYFSLLRRKLSETVASLVNDPAGEPATLWTGEGTARHSINRRLWKRFFLAKRPRFNFVANAPNPDGPTDETVTTAELRSTTGEPLALLWNYACHPVSHPDDRSYSSHFPGAVRGAMRDVHGEVPILFFQGFSGDTRPNASARVSNPKEVIRRALSGPLFDDMNWHAYRKWTASLTAVVARSFANSQRFKGGEVEVSRIEIPGSQLASAGRPMVFQLIRFGDALEIIGVSGEPVVEYAKTVRSESKTEKTMCVGCIDEPAGYIPTDQMILEGGYESDRSRPHFGVGEYHTGYQSIIERALRRVSRSSQAC